MPERVEVQSNVRDRDDPGDYDYVSIEERHQLFEQRLAVQSSGEFAANSNVSLDGAFDIPDHLRRAIKDDMPTSNGNCLLAST